MVGGSKPYITNIKLLKHRREKTLGNQKLLKVTVENQQQQELLSSV